MLALLIIFLNLIRISNWRFQNQALAVVTASFVVLKRHTKGHFTQHLKPEARAKVFSKTSIFVTAQSTACNKHFDGHTLRSDCYAKIKMESNCFNASSNYIEELLSEMRKLTESSNKVDFDSPDSLSESDYLR